MFAYYKDELDSISAKHVALVELVREHLSERLRGNTSADLGTISEIRDLRDRLYTFVACGVHSTVKDEADSLDMVKRLGFCLTDEPPKEEKLPKTAKPSRSFPIANLANIFGVK